MTIPDGRLRRIAESGRTEGLPRNRTGAVASVAADFSSSRLARRALLITTMLAFAGSALGVVAIVQGTVVGFEIR